MNDIVAVGVILGLLFIVLVIDLLITNNRKPDQ